MDLEPPDEAVLRELVQNEQGFAAKEAVYMLARLDRLKDRHLLRDIQRHPSPHVRLALIQEIDQVPTEVATWVLVELMRDESSRVRVAAIETLAQRGDASGIQALDHALDRPEFDEEPESVKKAYMVALASVRGLDAVGRLEYVVRRADAWMARRTSEETALAALYGLAQIRHPAAVDVLKAAVSSRNRAVRVEAKRHLERMKGDAP
ncbi:MAG: HEAT repeat domain-containing protein [Myxococcales bacterium]|nr:HEAT repeat domain-containing protein [Myxococcales bacterium]